MPRVYIPEGSTTRAGFKGKSGGVTVSRHSPLPKLVATPNNAFDFDDGKENPTLATTPRHIQIKSEKGSQRQQQQCSLPLPSKTMESASSKTFRRYRRRKPQRGTAPRRTTEKASNKAAESRDMEDGNDWSIVSPTMQSSCRNAAAPKENAMIPARHANNKPENKAGSNAVSSTTNAEKLKRLGEEQAAVSVEKGNSSCLKAAVGKENSIQEHANISEDKASSNAKTSPANFEKLKVVEGEPKQAAVAVEKANATSVPHKRNAIGAFVEEVTYSPPEGPIVESRRSKWVLGEWSRRNPRGIAELARSDLGKRTPSSDTSKAPAGSQETDWMDSVIRRNVPPSPQVLPNSSHDTTLPFGEEVSTDLDGSRACTGPSRLADGILHSKYHDNGFMESEYRTDLERRVSELEDKVHGNEQCMEQLKQSNKLWERIFQETNKEVISLRATVEHLKSQLPAATGRASPDGLSIPGKFPLDGSMHSRKRRQHQANVMTPGLSLDSMQTKRIRRSQKPPLSSSGKTKLFIDDISDSESESES